LEQGEKDNGGAEGGCGKNIKNKEIHLRKNDSPFCFVGERKKKFGWWNKNWRGQVEKSNNEMNQTELRFRGKVNRQQNPKTEWDARKMEGEGSKKNNLIFWGERKKPAQRKMFRHKKLHENLNGGKKGKEKTCGPTKRSHCNEVFGNKNPKPDAWGRMGETNVNTKERSVANIEVSKKYAEKELKHTEGGTRKLETQQKKG